MGGVDHGEAFDMIQCRCINNFAYGGRFPRTPAILLSTRPGKDGHQAASERAPALADRRSFWWREGICKTLHAATAATQEQCVDLSEAWHRQPEPASDKTQDGGQSDFQNSKEPFGVSCSS